MIVLEDVWTAIDRGNEALAQIQLGIAKRARLSGDTTVYDKSEIMSMRLYSNLIALTEFSLNHSIEENKTVEMLYNNIKLITKDYRQWH